jgi:superfamily II helicase
MVISEMVDEVVIRYICAGKCKRYRVKNNNTYELDGKSICSSCARKFLKRALGNVEAGSKRNR